MAYQTLYLNCCLWLSLCCSMLFYVVEDLPTTQLFHSFHNIYLPKKDGDIQYQHNGQSQQIALSMGAKIRTFSKRAYTWFPEDVTIIGDLLSFVLKHFNHIPVATHKLAASVQHSGV